MGDEVGDCLQFSILLKEMWKCMVKESREKYATENLHMLHVEY